MNRLNLARRTQIINCLAEGNSIRSTERLTSTHRDTIMRLLVEAGEGCTALLDTEMRNLPCRRIQVDEIGAFVGKKQKQLKPSDDRSLIGDQWTYVAIDPETKLIPVHRVGKRDLPTATAFLTDLSEREERCGNLVGDRCDATRSLPVVAGEGLPSTILQVDKARRRGCWALAHHPP